MAGDNRVKYPWLRADRCAAHCGWPLLVFGLLCSGGAMAGKVGAADVDPEIEQRLAQARQKLDDAARELAELNRAKFGGHRTNPDQAMLGILVDDEGEADGIRLHGLTPGGGAAAAGLKIGDRLVAINGERLGGNDKSPLHNLNRVMRGLKAGDPASVRYVRDGVVQEATVITRSHQRDMLAMLDDLEHQLNVDLDLDATELGDGLVAAALSSLDGMELTNSKIILHQQTEPRLATVDKDLGSYFGVDQGVLVLAVPEDAGDLRSGDILLSVDGKPTTDLTIARALLAQAGDRAVSARIRRHGKEQTAQIQPRSFVRGAQRAHNIHIESDGDGVEIIVEEDAQDGSR